jgi:energy-coupling factor transport system ATP-binding protein
VAPLLALQDVGYRYEGQGGTVAALRDVRLAIPRGAFVAVVGANGSGKSTLARLLDGLLLPTSGRVLVDGLDTADAAARWEVRRRVGLVFQNPDNQIVASVVEDDVAFGPENLGVPPPEIRARVDAALAAVGLSDLRHRSPEELSGGQKQRVAIAGALAMQPQALVLDEPTALLDPRGRAEVMAVLRRLHRRDGLTVVLITHHMEEAAQAERVVVLAEGRVLRDGPPAAVFAEPDRLRELGLDVPEAAVIAAQLRRAGVALPEGLVTVEDLAAALLPQLGVGRRLAD